MKLEEQHAVEGAQKLPHEEIEKLKQEVPEWEIHEDRMERAFKFADFVEAMRFANRITNLAQEQNHHPDLHISYGKARVELSTHRAGGLTMNDFILAAKIDRLPGQENVPQAI